GDAGDAAAATRDPVPAARRAAAVSAGLPRHAATASGHAVGGRRLPAASRPLRGSPATVGCRVDAAASVSEPFGLVAKGSGETARVKKAGGATARSCVQKPPRNRLMQVR